MYWSTEMAAPENSANHRRRTRASGLVLGPFLPVADFVAQIGLRSASPSPLPDLSYGNSFGYSPGFVAQIG